MSTPSSAIRDHCLWCCNDNRSEVVQCPARQCPLWSLRLRARYLPLRAALMDDATPLHPFERPMTLGEFAAKGQSKLKAIRRRCVDCSGGNAQDVTSCDARDCALWTYRDGHNPALTGKRGNAAALARFRKVRGGPAGDDEAQAT